MGMYETDAEMVIMMKMAHQPRAPVQTLPVILPQTMIGDWINPGNKADEIISEALTDMVFEKVV